GQLATPLGWEMVQKTNGAGSETEAFRELIDKQHVGTFWATLRADPWTQRTLETGLNPGQSAEALNALQKYAVEETRLGIPLLFSEECAHGHMAIGTTVFPTSIGQASTWNPNLIEEMASVIAKEARLQGATTCYGPVLDLAREPRWSRVEETYGEDSALSGAMGAAMVRGFQGANLASGENVISTLKHFAAYGVPIGGHNGSAVLMGPRDLHTQHLYPFKMAVNAGAKSVMTAYNSIDGVPNTSNRALLTNTLRDEWGFDGFVVSDLYSIDGIAGSHRVAKNIQEAAVLSIRAGVDTDLGANGFGAPLLKAVEDGLITEELIDRSVRRVLRQKFDLGLFEKPYVDPDRAESDIRTNEHKELARQVARESLILLKNNDDLLPLSKDVGSVAVIGPNAHNIYNQLGDYSAPQPPENIITVLEGIQHKLPDDAAVRYVRGTAIRDTLFNEIDLAVEAAENSDVAIVVLGGSSARDFETSYEETGAALVNREAISDMESGEGFDRATLTLMGRQLELLEAISDTGTPVVLVLIKGRPLMLNQVSEQASAIVDAWYPGQEGGNAIADVLFGDYNPAGRLPISVPKSEGQLPVYYNHLKPAHHDYVELDASPLYSFGYGLSYTTFDYSNLQTSVHETANDLSVRVSATIENIGQMDGDEVVQLYIRDDISSVVTPVQQLRAFQRIHIPSGEKRAVSFELTAADLKLLNPSMSWVVESGTFTMMLGASSDDIRLESQFEIRNGIHLSTVE
ncbi:MAG: beta-glucosidase, partial [Bacteroidetes bacterium]|nr:beta-glucosidase [Bacteroidota bacterium]